MQTYMYLSWNLGIFWAGPLCYSMALVPGLKKKLVLLEEFNTDLAKLKTTAEAQAMQLDEQLMRSRMENKKLQDWNELRGMFEMKGTPAFNGNLIISPDNSAILDKLNSWMEK